MRTLKQLIDEAAEVKKKVDDFENSINRIRHEPGAESNGAWHKNVKRDERFIVQFLYTEYMKYKQEYVDMLCGQYEEVKFPQFGGNL